jgi:hypothetical protein
MHVTDALVIELLKAEQTGDVNAREEAYAQLVRHIDATHGTTFVKDLDIEE